MIVRSLRAPASIGSPAADRSDAAGRQPIQVAADSAAVEVAAGGAAAAVKGAMGNVLRSQRMEGAISFLASAAEGVVPKEGCNWLGLRDDLIGLTAAAGATPDTARPALILRPRGMALLKILARDAGYTFSPEELARKAKVKDESTKAIRVHICQIRTEMRRHGLAESIENVWGRGYRLAPQYTTEVRQIIRETVQRAAADYLF